MFIASCVCLIIDLIYVLRCVYNLSINSIENYWKLTAVVMLYLEIANLRIQCAHLNQKLREGEEGLVLSLSSCIAWIPTHKHSRKTTMIVIYRIWLFFAYISLHSPGHMFKDLNEPIIFLSYCPFPKSPICNYFCRRTVPKQERLHLLGCIFLVFLFIAWIKQQIRWADEYTQSSTSNLAC